MEFWEAIKLLQEGKKVRRKVWDKCEFLWLEESTGYIHHSNTCADTLFSIRGVQNDWEVYDDRNEPDALTKHLYDVINQIMHRDRIDYDNYIDYIAVDSDKVDYVTKLYKQLQDMNRKYKLSDDM